MRYCLTLLFFTCCLLSVKAGKEGKVVTVKSTYTLEIPKYMSYAQACREGIVKARNQAIDSAFYSVVSATNIVNITNQNEKSSVSSISINRSEVRGIWLGDLAEPYFERTIASDGRDFLNITVKGKIRELTSAGIEFEALPLRVKPDKQLESNNFKEGDDFFLYFKSPADGYLTVFLFDTTLNEVCYLLPYHNSGLGSYPIKHDEDYIFFSPETAKPDDGRVDELVMTCSEGNQEEYDELYVVFSPNRYSKVSSNIERTQLDDHLVLPERMSYKDFNNWLMKYQQKDEDMQVARISVHITK